MSPRALIAGYARTPFMKFNGALARVPAVALGAHAVTAALQRAGISPADVDYVYGGQVLQAGAGQNPARQAARTAGIGWGTPAVTLNAVCLSGALAVSEGARLIEQGLARVVVAVGMESMSLAPHAWVGSRAGRKYGAMEVLDTLEHDGLSDAFERVSMGLLTDRSNETLGIDRAEQDRWAALSHTRLTASAAQQAEEIAPLELPGRGGSVTLHTDDGGRPETSVESLSRLRPAFSPDGTVTAGNSSQLTDGAAAIVLVAEGSELDGEPLAAVASHALVAGPDVSLQAQPAEAILEALRRAGLTAADLGPVEINEAFASVASHSAALLGKGADEVNLHGGAIALGHPIGASGTRIIGSLAASLKRQQLARFGAAGICGGGGQGAAVVLEAL